MEDQSLNNAIHSTLTALSVAVGRLEEQMKSMKDDLRYHTQNEHQEFKQALATVTEIKDDVATLQSLLDRSKGAWWALAKVAGVIAFGVTAIGVAVSIVKQFWHQ